jgi:hypothetical protein
MRDHESNIESTAQVEAPQADRRAFMKSAVKTVVAGTAVVGLAASIGNAEAAPTIAATCGGSLDVPRAVVKAKVLFNNQMGIKRQDIIDLLGGIFDKSTCPTCGLGGFPGPFEPGTVLEITLGTAFLQRDQPVDVIFTEAGGGF